MPDILTQEERAAIANYRGKVQIIPRGTSAFEYGAADVNVWNNKTSHGLAKKTRERHSRNRKEFRDLCESGKTIQQIADLLGVLPSSVRKRANMMNIRIKADGKVTGQFNREEMCMKMVEEGYSVRTIAAELGMARSSVQRMKKRLGLR